MTLEPAPAPGVFLVVEGTTGVGKTSTASDLRTLLGARLFHFGLDGLRSPPPVDSFEDLQPMARVTYCLAATLELSDRVRAALLRGHVVCDRYAASPLAVLDVASVIDPADMASLARPIRSRLVLPSCTLLLRADHATAVERLRSRPRRNGLMRWVHQKAMVSREFYESWEASLRRRVASLGPFIELDTTALSRSQMRAAARAQALDVLAPLVRLDW